MNNYQLQINYQVFKSIKELDDSDRLLCEQAVEALKTSYSPYSKFAVGTAIRLKDQTLVSGSNQENVAYPSGLCAERVALFSIGAQYPGQIIESMAITASTSQFTITYPVTSCGACLQVMAEFEQKQQAPIAVIFYCIDGEIIKVDSVKSLLPFGFVEERLGAKL